MIGRLALTRSAARKRRSDPFGRATAIAAGVAPLLVVLIVIVIAQQAAPAIQGYGWAFLVHTAWNPVTMNFGALPFIYGTVATSFIALLIALPVGVGVAVFLAEPGAARLRGAIGIGVELLAAIPSVVYGIWGLYVLAPWLLTHVDRPVSARFGSLAIFEGPARQTSVFAAGIVLAVMILPTLAAVSREVIRAVPGGLRESGVALGATWWETTWRLVLRAARPGIFGATVLAFGRALGETVAVTMVIGNRPEIRAAIFAPGYTLASVIANEFTEATGRLYPAALLELGLVLLLVTLVVNVGALLMVRVVGRDVQA